MKEGLLWFDDHPGRDLAEKILLGAQHYRQKYGAEPDTCCVHPSALRENSQVRQINGVRVTSRPSVLRHHFWLGREEA
jgi:hypothetical protein